MQSEPAIPNSRQLPSIYSMKEPKYEQSVDSGSLRDTIEPPAIVKQPRRSKQSSDGGEILLPVKR